MLRYTYLSIVGLNMARGRPTRIDIAKPDIVELFASSHRRVYGFGELSAILAQNRDDWPLAQETTARSFIEYLVAETRLKEVRLTAQNYPDARETVRYLWGDVTPYALALSLKPNAYLCHATAVF